MKPVLPIVPFVLAAAAVQAETVNFDGGSPGVLPSQWVAGATGRGTPKWTVEVDPGAPSKPNVLRQSGQADFAWCVLKETSLADGFVEVKFRPIGGRSDQAGGAVWRWKDGDHYYVARANALENNVSLYYTERGRRITIKYADAPVARDTWHLLRVEFEGPRIRVALNGKVYIELDDAHIAGAGAVGVWTKADSVTAFDDFSYGGVTDGATPVSAVSFAEAFRFWLKLGFISFGGPAGQIAIMHDELVERRRWISENRFLHALNYCMVLPGPEAQQLATYIGWLMHRTWGGIVAGGLFVLPSLFVLIALSWVYLAYGDVPAIAGVLYGIKPAVTAVVVFAAYRIGSRALKNGVLWAIAVAAFVAIFALHAPFPAIVLAAGIMGFIGGRLVPDKFRAGGGHAVAKPSRAGTDRRLDAHTRARALLLGTLRPGARASGWRSGSQRWHSSWCGAGGRTR